MAIAARDPPLQRLCDGFGHVSEADVLQRWLALLALTVDENGNFKGYVNGQLVVSSRENVPEMTELERFL
jgi:uncharacterized membrane protein YukC